MLKEELAMTVHARQLARLCRERLAAHEELPVLQQQPEQQQAAVDTPQENAETAEEAAR
jgi:hypothetical protein